MVSTWSYSTGESEGCVIGISPATYPFNVWTRLHMVSCRTHDYSKYDWVEASQYIADLNPTTVTIQLIIV